MSNINFNGLKSTDGKVSEQEFNRLVDAIQSVALNQAPGYRLNRSPVGTSLNITFPHFSGSGITGTCRNPYIMGMTGDGSDDPYTDTWEVDNQPSGYDGVTYSGYRFYDMTESIPYDVVDTYPGGHKNIAAKTIIIFPRQMTWDSLGALRGISGEGSGVKVSYVDLDYSAGDGS